MEQEPASNSGAEPVLGPDEMLPGITMTGTFRALVEHSLPIRYTLRDS